MYEPIKSPKVDMHYVVQTKDLLLASLTVYLMNTETIILDTLICHFTKGLDLGIESCGVGKRII